MGESRSFKGQRGVLPDTMSRPEGRVGRVTDLKSAPCLLRVHRRWPLLDSKPLHTLLAGLAPLTFRVGGTFTDFTLMHGPRPGVSK
eukprot:SAG11_NODE_13881_length_635_cov_0.664179_2_plen_85_part_01